MALLMLLLRVPFLPLQGVIRLAEMVRDEAERQDRDPATARRQLEQIAAAEAAGQITAEERQALEREALSRLIGQPYGNTGAAGMPTAGW